MTYDLKTTPRVNSSEPFAPRPRPATPAHIIKSDEEAIAVAHRVAAEFAKGDSLRDRGGYLDLELVDAFSQSGLWGINIPKAYGGAGVSNVTLAEVIKILAAGDPAVTQPIHNHLAIVGHVELDGTEEQKREIFGLVLQGVRLGNAFSELNSKTVAAFETRLTFDGNDAVINGQKFYTTGALLAHIVPIVAVDDSNLYLVFADRETPGLNIINDWSGFGQRVTVSGSAKLDNVRVPKSRVVTVTAFNRHTIAGPVSQIIVAAIDQGIAYRAIDEAIAFVKSKARTWVDSGKEKASEDPFTIQAIGDLKLRLHAADAILERAGRLIDEGRTNETEDFIAKVTLATSEAKVLTTEVALLATNRLFELAGTRSVLSENNLDRHWRNARTHTLHDPVRWKFFHLGNYYLNGVNPPRHAWN
jgi:SfnB family sulfur acquisition oxidoreductase